MNGMVVFSQSEGLVHPTTCTTGAFEEISITILMFGKDESCHLASVANCLLVEQQQQKAIYAKG